MDLVRKSDRLGLLFTRDRSGAGPERIQNWTCFFTGTILDPFGSFQNGPVQTEADPVRFKTVPVPRRHSLKK